MVKRFSRLRVVNWQSQLLLLFLMCQPACQAQPPPTTPAASKATERATGADPKTRVSALLAAIPRGEPVLGALTARQRARLDQLLSSLSEQELNELLAPEGELARRRPLLHLMAGGRSRAALFALATTTGAADELLGLLASPDEFGEVLVTTNEVIVRAALEWVGHAQRMLEEEQGLDVLFCEALDQ